jgi:aryl-alcohol dehydrogenase-like predicted oxidoreductase
MGRPAYINVDHAADFAAGRTHDAMRARTHEVLDAAFARGVRYVDAARSYGDAEVFARGWLDARGLVPGSVTIGSKWGYVYEANWQLDVPRHERKDHSLDGLRHQLAETLAILGPHLRLYQIHSATLESAVLRDEAVLDALAVLRDSGVAVGVTTSGPHQAEVIREAIAISRGGPLFATVQATWNVMETSSEAALREAHDAGVVVIVKEALANGRLGPRDPAGAGLDALAGHLGVTRDALALAAVLARPWADLVLLGASTVDQLRSNVRALEVALDRRQLASLDELRVDAETYWRERSHLPWN